MPSGGPSPIGIAAISASRILGADLLPPADPPPLPEERAGVRGPRNAAPDEVLGEMAE